MSEENPVLADDVIEGGPAGTRVVLCGRAKYFDGTNFAEIFSASFVLVILVRERSENMPYTIIAFQSI